MAQDMKIHSGYWDTPSGKQDTAWVVTTLELRVGPLDLVNALGSKFLRHEVTEDDAHVGDRPQELPLSMTQREIMTVFREEFRHYGEEVLGMWGDEMGSRRRDACERWVREVVDDAFPGLKGFKR